jgi:hypothetical protein
MGDRATGHVRFLTAATMLLLAGCGGSSTSPTHPPVSGVTFEMQGVVLGSCAAAGLGPCPDSPFGAGVAPGTPFTGHVTFDPNTTPVALSTLATSRAVRFFGVSVDFTVGSQTVSGNNPTTSFIELDSGTTFEQFTVTVNDGFSSGQIGGLPINVGVFNLQIVPTQFPNATLPADPHVFDAALGAPGGGVFLVQHAFDPSLAVLGLLAPGSRLQGQVTSVRLR